MRQGPTHLSIRAVLLPSLVLAWCATVSGGEAEFPASRLGVRTAPLLLLSRPDVRADLKLDPAQATSADRAIAELWIKASALRGRTGAEAVAARRSIDEAQRAWLESQLSDDQRRRLAQIDLQWEGPSALLSRPLVAEGLGLDAEQRAALGRAIAERDRRRVGGQGRPEDERTLARQALELLTPDQRERWQAMLGPPFIPEQVAAAPAIAPGSTR